MTEKLSLEDLKKCVKELEKEVAEHKKAEEELRLHSEILNQMAEGVYLITASDAVIVYANEMFESMFGYDHGELVGKHVSIVNAPGERSPEEVTNEIIQSLNDNGTWSGEVHNIKKDGTLFWCYANISTFDHREFGQVSIAVHQDISDGKEAEEKLSNSLKHAQYLADIVRHASVGIADGYPDGGVGLCNKAFQQLTGYSEEELKRINWTEVLTPPEWRGYEIAKLEELHRAKKPVYYEKEYIRKDGSRVPAELVVHPRLGDDGNVESYFAFITDISQRKQAQDALRNAYEKLEQRVQERTARLANVNEQLKLEIEERKRAEEALKEERNKAQKYLDIAGVMMVAVDAAGDVTLINKKGCEVLGYEQWEIVGKSWFDNFLPERMRDEVKGVSLKLLAGQVEPVEYYENRVLTKNGQERVIAWHNTVLRDEAGDIIGHLSSGADITERKQTEEALRASEQRYRTLLENLPQKIFHKNRDSLYVSCNENYARDLRIEPEEIRGKTDYDFYPQELAEKYRMDDQRTVTSGNTEELEEKYVQDGQEMWVQTVKTPVKDGEGSITGVLGIFWDITEKKKAEEENNRLQAQLQQAQKMEAIGTLAGGIAHDFNNILAAIMGYTELVMEDVPQGSTVQSNLEEIFRAGIRAQDLVGQILAFSRQSEHKKGPLQPIPIIKEALKLLGASLPTTIEIRQNIGGQSDTILADPTQIHRVLMNLCTNAVHAIQEKGGPGVLEVTLDDVDVDADAAAQHSDLKRGPYARLTVSDTGCGMDQMVLERAFDPFFTTKTVGKGTGMGLSVVHGIVKDHGGAILADSKPGKGTTFQVFFPKIETQEAQHEAIGPLPTGNERILFVDDEKAVVAVGKKSLEGLGYKVVAKTSSIEALEAFRAQPDKFDLVITDLTMPNMTGAELQKELVAIRQDIPVILCTGFGQRVSEENAKAMGINQLIMKPFLKSDIAKTIRRVLDNPSALS